MPENIEKLKRAIHDWLVRNQLEDEPCFYNIKDWRARQEKYLNDSELVLTFSGGLYMVINYGGDVELIDEFEDLVFSFGYYFELGEAWNMGFYKLDDYNYKNDNKTYSQKLQDARWIAKANLLKERSNYTCEDCGQSTHLLEVHHCYYVYGYEPWEYPYDALRCLCRSCHKARSQAEFRMRGFMASLKHSEIDILRKSIQNALYWYDSEAVFSLLAALKPDEEKLKSALLNLLNHKKSEPDVE